MSSSAKVVIWLCAFFVLRVNSSTLSTETSTIDVSREKNCSLVIWYHGLNVTNQRMTIFPGDNTILICDASCSTSYYSPVLKWWDPRHHLINDIPGLRVFSSPMTSHRLHSLYIQSLEYSDEGTYTCRGYIGHWTSVHVILDLDSQTKEMMELDPR